MKNSNVSAACLVPSDRVVKFASKMKANAADEHALQLEKKFLDEEYSDTDCTVFRAFKLFTLLTGFMFFVDYLIDLLFQYLLHSHEKHK